MGRSLQLSRERTIVIIRVWSWGLVREHSEQSIYFADADPGWIPDTTYGLPSSARSVPWALPRMPQSPKGGKKKSWSGLFSDGHVWCMEIDLEASEEYRMPCVCMIVAGGFWKDKGGLLGGIWEGHGKVQESPGTSWMMYFVQLVPTWEGMENSLVTIFLWAEECQMSLSVRFRVTMGMDVSCCAAPGWDALRAASAGGQVCLWLREGEAMVSASPPFRPSAVGVKVQMQVYMLGFWKHSSFSFPGLGGNR